MTDRTPEEARAQIAFALQAKRLSLASATDAMTSSPDDEGTRRVVARLTEDIERLEIQLKITG